MRKAKLKNRETHGRIVHRKRYVWAAVTTKNTIISNSTDKTQMAGDELRNGSNKKEIKRGEKGEVTAIYGLYRYVPL